MSVNSGVDDIKKADATKKRNSIKKKVQNFSGECDDAALVPLLETNKTERNIASAKFVLPKTKTDSLSEKDRQSVDIEKGALSSLKPVHDSSIVVCNPAVVQNHMNTNVFGNMIASETPKTSVLIELSEKKMSSFNTPMIFTTAKIHTDTKTKMGEHITPVPILSTIEGNQVKSEVNLDKTLPGRIDATNKISFETHQIISETSDRTQNQLITKSSINRLTDCVKTSVYTTVTQSDIAKAKKSEVTKATIDSINTTDISTQNTSEISSTLLSKSKPDSTSSMKKLQRQKHTEDTNVILQNNPTKKDNNIKTNGTTPSDVKRFSSDLSIKSPSDLSSREKSIPSTVNNKSIKTTQEEEIKSPTACKQEITVSMAKPVTIQKITSIGTKDINKSPIASSMPTNIKEKTTSEQKTITSIKSGTDAKELTTTLGSSKLENTACITTISGSMPMEKIASSNTGKEIKGAPKSSVSLKSDATSITTNSIDTSTPKSVNTKGTENKEGMKSLVSKAETSNVTKSTTTSMLISEGAIKTEAKDTTKTSVSSKHEDTTVKHEITATRKINTSLKQEPKTFAKHKSNIEAKSAVPTSNPEAIVKNTQKQINNKETKSPSKTEVSSVEMKPITQKTLLNTATETLKSTTPTQNVPKDNRGMNLSASKLPKSSVKAENLKSPTKDPSQPGAKPKAGNSEVPSSKTKLPSYIVPTSKTKIGTPNIVKSGDAGSSVPSISNPEDGRSDQKYTKKS